jgi:hypothetical protein
MYMSRDYLGYATSHKIPDEYATIVAADSQECASSSKKIHLNSGVYLKQKALAC